MGNTGFVRRWRFWRERFLWVGGLEGVEGYIKRVAMEAEEAMRMVEEVGGWHDVDGKTRVLIGAGAKADLGRQER